jgi:hypothetical protein
MNKNQYILPKSKIILEALFTLTYFLIILGLFIIPIILDLKNSIHLGTGLLYWGFFLLWFLPAISYFAFLQFWANLFSSPVRKWALANIRCPGCGHEFTRCDVAFRGANLSYESLVMSCKNCKEVYFMETGIFNRKLSFSKDHSSGFFLRYKEKYFGKIFDGRKR